MHLGQRTPYRIPLKPEMEQSHTAGPSWKGWSVAPGLQTRSLTGSFTAFTEHLPWARCWRWTRLGAWTESRRPERAPDSKMDTAYGEAVWPRTSGIGGAAQSTEHLSCALQDHETGQAERQRQASQVRHRRRTA